MVAATQRRLCSLKLSMLVTLVSIFRFAVTSSDAFRFELPSITKGRPLNSLKATADRQRISDFAYNFHEFVLDKLINTQAPLDFTKPQTLLQSPVPKKDSQRRTIDSITKYNRIPTWPVSNGLWFQSVERVNPKLAVALEDRYGGADCPQIFLNDPDLRQRASPFLMLCHHNHSFNLVDPTRLVEKGIIPEGFPSHAHRGMITLTIVLRGGLKHRDSMGIQQEFGTHPRYKGKHTQWLHFGAGVVHELMWDNNSYNIARAPTVVHQEIYQLWLDLPSDLRMTPPSVNLLGGSEETPTVTDSRTETLIIVGSHNRVKAKCTDIELPYDVSVLKVQMKPNSQWMHSTHHETIILYVRKGSIVVEGKLVSGHCTAMVSTSGELRIQFQSDGADILVMTGMPLGQAVEAKGSMVVETGESLNQAFQDSNDNRMGMPWKETLTDSEWLAHVQIHPCQYDKKYNRNNI